MSQPQRGRRSAGPKRRPTFTRSTQRRMRNQRMRRTILLIVAITVVCLAASAAIGRCQSKHRRSTDYSGPLDPRALTMVEMPAGVVSEIIDYDAMTVSFNRELHLPNWVAWELTAEHSDGTEPRTNRFYQDWDVEGCASPDDYRNSGYDRGHMAPAGDMKWDSRAMEQSFLMTNITPQYPDLNRGTWRRLEEKSRVKASRDSAIYIVCGPIVEQPVEMTIGQTGVAVPDKFFKVIISPYAKRPQGIGFIFPNGPTPGGMQSYAVSIDSVEALTGYNFFPTLPAELEQELESKVNFTRWSSSH